MSTAKRPTLIAAGYALSVGAGFAAVAVNELFMPADVAQTSPGMAAFGDMILFVLVAGFVSLVPTWFLLKLFVEKAPRTLLAIELLIAALNQEQTRSLYRTSPAGLHTRVYAEGGATLLKAFEDQLLGQIILDQAVIGTPNLAIFL